MEEMERAKDILETILDRWGSQCVTTQYAVEYIAKHLYEVQGKEFTITTLSER